MRLEKELSPCIKSDFNSDEFPKIALSKECDEAGKRAGKIGGFVGAGIGTITALALGFYVHKFKTTFFRMW